MTGLESHGPVANALTTSHGLAHARAWCPGPERMVPSCAGLTFINRGPVHLPTLFINSTDRDKQLN